MSLLCLLMEHAKGYAQKHDYQKFSPHKVCPCPSQLNRWRPAPFLPFTVHSRFRVSQYPVQLGQNRQWLWGTGRSEQNLRQCPVACPPPPPKKEHQQSPGQVPGVSYKKLQLLWWKQWLLCSGSTQKMTDMSAFQVIKSTKTPKILQTLYECIYLFSTWLSQSTAVYLSTIKTHTKCCTCCCQ